MVISDEVLKYIHALAYSDTVHDFRSDRNTFGKLRDDPDIYLINRNFWEKEDIQNINTHLQALHFKYDGDNSKKPRKPSLSKWENGLINNIEEFMCNIDKSQSCNIFKNYSLINNEPIEIDIEETPDLSNINDIIGMNLNRDFPTPIIVNLPSGNDLDDDETNIDSEDSNGDNNDGVAKSQNNTKKVEENAKKNMARAILLKKILVLISGNTVKDLESEEIKQLNFFLDCDSLGILKYYIFNKFKFKGDMVNLDGGDKILAVYKWGVPQTLDTAGRPKNFNVYREFLGIDTQPVNLVLNEEEGNKIIKKFSDNHHYVKLPGLDKPELWIKSNLEVNNGEYWDGVAKILYENSETSAMNSMEFIKKDYKLSVEKLSEQFKNNIEKNKEFNDFVDIEYKDGANISLPLGKVFDLKRMMDWYQVIFLYLFGNQINGYNYFVTFDILAAAFARLLKVPCILEKTSEKKIIIFPGAIVEQKEIDNLRFKCLRSISVIRELFLKVNEFKTDKANSLGNKVTGLEEVISHLESLIESLIKPLIYSFIEEKDSNSFILNYNNNKLNGIIPVLKFIENQDSNSFIINKIKNIYKNKIVESDVNVEIDNIEGNRLITYYLQKIIKKLIIELNDCKKNIEESLEPLKDKDNSLINSILSGNLEDINTIEKEIDEYHQNYNEIEEEAKRGKLTKEEIDKMKEEKIDKMKGKLTDINVMYRIYNKIYNILISTNDIDHIKSKLKNEGYTICDDNFLKNYLKI